MTAPSYTTDLNDICLMETGDTFEEFTGYELGDNAALEADWYIQGNSCASDEANNKSGVGHSIGYDYGSPITFSAGDCFFAWMFCMMPNAPDTIANGGYRLLMGSSVSVFYGWYVGGKDFGRNPYGGWQNFAVDPTFTPDDSSHGSPTTWQHFAAAYKLVNTTLKGRPICADAFRYGRGEVIIEYGETSNYGTFAGIAAQNDSQNNRWGLFQAEGTGYLWKGLLSFGNSTNACDFRDSNVNITIDNTPRTYALFNKIEINNASSRVDWTGVNFNALSASQLSKGTLTVVDNATVNLDTCTFTDMFTLTFQSNSTLDNVTFRRCGTVLQGGAEINNCIFEKCVAGPAPATSPIPALSSTISTYSNLTNCSFISSGQDFGIELGSVTSSASITWDHFSSGFATSDGSTGNETISVNVSSGQTLTINVAAGRTKPSVYNAGSGTVTVLEGQVTLEVEVRDADTGATISGARVYTETTSGGDMAAGVALISGSLTNAVGIASDTRSYTADQPFVGWVRKGSSSPYYKTATIAGTIDNSSGAFVVAQMVKDE